MSNGIIYIYILVAIIARVYSTIIDEEFKYVTCGSNIKLANRETNYRLHSHEVKYGTGSTQQSVTAYPEGNDPNSYFKVIGMYDSNTNDQSNCKRATAIECGQIIRLFHSSTMKYLHSHLHRSPLSSNQEVSAYVGTDSGDNWKVGCVDKSAKYWQREQMITLQHVDTSLFLSSAKSFMYSQPIQGQLEVSAKSNSGNSEKWVAKEGIYFEKV